MAAVIPHFGTVMSWDGSVDASGASVPEDKRRARKPSAIAAEVLADVDPSDLSLVGELSGCQGLFATSLERKVTVFSTVEPDAQAHTAAEQALRALPQYKRALSDYQKAMRELAEEPVAEDWPLTTAVRGFGPNARYIAVTAARSGGCADYEDSLTAVWVREGNGLRPVATARRATLPWLLVDLDDDGALELITGGSAFAGRRLERFVRDEAQPMRIVPVSYHDCPC